MASGTINGSTGNQYIDSKIVWSATPTTSTNSSEVTAALYYKRNNSGFTTYGEGTFSITIGGNKTSVTKNLTITEDAWVKAVEATETITHDSDGTKSITISGAGSMSGTSLSSTSCSKTVDLDTIPRASTISSAASITLGKACSVKWTPKAKAFRYKLEFSLGSWSYKTSAIHPNTTEAYTYTGYTIPLDVANQITADDHGTMTVKLYSFSNTAATTQIGSTSSKTFTVTVPSNSSTQPKVTMELTPESTLGSPFNTLYIQGYSKVSASFTGSGEYGARISSYSMTVQGKTDTTSPYTSGYLTQTGSISVTGTATDSRGISGKTTKSITVLPYSKPKILPASGNEIICTRCDKDGNITSSGTYLKIKAKRSYSKVTSDGVQKNFCLIRYRYREESTTSFSNWATILAKTASSDTIDTKIANVVSSTTTSYVVQIGVVDDMGKTAAVQFVVPTDSVTLHLAKGGKRLGLLRYAENSSEEGIDVGAPIHGGAVDNLTLGTLLTATSSAPISLNDITEVGNYYSPSASNSQYITNAPYNDGGFSLTVRELQSKSMIRQELFYGRTNWQRHYSSATGEWSDWLRYLMTEYPDTTSADFVTEIGVWNVDNSDPDKGYWRYRKWKSGALDMNGLVQVFPETEGTLGTAGVYYSKVINLDLPFEVVNFNFTGSSTSYHCFVGNCNSVDGNNKQIRLRLYRFTDFAGLVDYKVYVRIVASGKLKT